MENQLHFKYKEPTDGLKQGKPVKIYKRENTTDYYLLTPKEPTRNGEINQLMLHCINEMGRQKNRYVFSLNDYFSFHNVIPELIPEIKQAIIEIKAMINPIWYNEFTPLIKEWIDNWNVQKEQKTEKHKNIEIDTLLQSQNFLIPLVPMKFVYDHFVVLTQKTNKFNEFYLTNDQLFLFLKSTFIDKKPIKQKLNCEPFNKKSVRTIFYEFYQKAKNKERNQTSLKRKYFNILNNSFEGFNENDYKDFNKT